MLINNDHFVFDSTSIETPEISMAFKETSSRSLSGVETINSGSQLFKLHNKEKIQ